MSLLNRTQQLSPAYFGLVMATGIIAIAAKQQQWPSLAYSLFTVACISWFTLLILFSYRFIRFFRDFTQDLVSHNKGPGFFTTVAGTALIGSQSLILFGWYWFAFIAWMLALFLWVLLTYTIFTALTIRHNKPSLDKGINGAWLLAVVATQSVAVLSALIAAQTDQPWKVQLNFLALSMWLWGGMLYIWMMSLIFYRYTFFEFSPSDLAPPYWINMGAMAISTLAGSLLIINSQNAPFLDGLVPFLKGFTIFYWATGSWWIPMLLILGIWRHLVCRFPLTYDPLYWGAVFPLGMYSACTYVMLNAMQFSFLSSLPTVFFYIAVIFWIMTFTGLCRRLLGLRHKE
ncbi:MAG: C4-dicarboxylate ABC transporter [Candidatus Scalindua sp. AMX11]|nr:MAG: C4-dicarboxylate ABC transporter [Candidatus Scalindua sp.]NOG84803.1 C4-dicarboxylate ABC transporter [Planctomycetota bacterium]RZV98403.1 MAG: C4-dicarboxylate ABC transporter [Candidatus Scalindua sp. SCAELEC01]TDE66501.1 MAG: C4-dicarboxylate ABC transporter [Candidatus Scalindua sp. AMX11]